jgi:hypothetical protein
MGSAIIASVDQESAPNPLPPCSDASALVLKALTERLTALEAQMDLAFSTDTAD